MAREIVTNLYCDFCMLRNPDDRVRASTVRVLLGDMREPRAIEVCPECYTLHLQPLAEVLEVMGKPMRGGSQPTLAGLRMPKGDTRTTADDFKRVCFLCDEQVGHPVRLNAHTAEVHGIRTADLLGSTCPLCGGKPWGTHQGLAVHCSKLHHKLMTDVFKEAEALGDPHGVVKALRERAEVAMRVRLVTA